MPTDDDDDRPRRRRVDDDDDRPRRSRRDDDDDDDRPRPKKKSGSGMMIGLVVGGVLLFMLCGGGLLVGLMLPAVQKVRQAAGRAKDQNNLKMVVLAAHNHHDATNEFTDGPGFKDPQNGKLNPNLSFRVGLLPYLEQDNVYRQFNLTEGWDSPGNRRLADIVVPPYSTTLDPVGTTATRYRGFVGKGTMFEPGTKISLMNVTDGTSNTIFIITADDGVPYSKVDELPYSATGPLPSIGMKAYPGGTNVAMCDGSVRFIKNTVSETTLRRLIERNDGMAIDPIDW